jgi:hypothetical protein
VRVWWWRLRCGAASGAAWGWPLVQLLLWVPGWRRLRELVKELPRQLSTRAGEGNVGEGAGCEPVVLLHVPHHCSSSLPLHLKSNDMRRNESFWCPWWPFHP